MQALLTTIGKHDIVDGVTWLIDELRAYSIAVFIKGVVKVAVADIATAVTRCGALQKVSAGFAVS